MKWWGGLNGPAAGISLPAREEVIRNVGTSVTAAVIVVEVLVVVVVVVGVAVDRVAGDDGAAVASVARGGRAVEPAPPSTMTRNFFPCTAFTATVTKYQ